MTTGQLKGALLEFTIRSLMLNCGFASVRPDGHYIFQQRGTGLFFINGKGAAHDADVLMEPPIQMPFSYPSRLLFECKSYDKTIGLDVIRNALGLRYDINEFEIVSEDSIKQRQNNRRANYAISNRKRYQYQIGVASIEEFSKPAFEFAANNKIPLLSLRWFLPSNTCDLFHQIDQNYLTSIPQNVRQLLYRYLKDKSPDSKDDSIYEPLLDYLMGDLLIGAILRTFDRTINRFVIGLLETGDLLFLFSRQDNVRNLMSEFRFSDKNEARIHYNADNPTRWTLSIRGSNISTDRLELKFNVPINLVQQWLLFNYDKTAGYNLKDQFFSRIFIFHQRFSNYGLPFTLINLDSEWINNLRND
ncbi:hypothetical protein [Pedobacter xixiisoli]|uniref:Restriction endonuclease n=1 Tax=Pedobacter xixiisoli TaxID=1476464 RepID=A0A285ZRE9_9SPHI|nr:hypothetical protein [Pedobacter xixiisoli]SOD12234.1 hypothetical protein SAMN06297358_0562 [Pedobacter xixiisoli]